MNSQARRARGSLVIKNVKVRNFRGLKSYDVTGCARVNIFVGDNGAGKTSLLEAIFFALSGSPATGLKLRQWRGGMGGLIRAEASLFTVVFDGFFYGGQTDRPIRIELEGAGPEARTLLISRGGQSKTISLNDEFADLLGDVSASRDFQFEWKDHLGAARSVTPKIENGELKFGGTDEELESFHYYSPHHAPSSSEVADMFSRLRLRFGGDDFVKAICGAFPWITDLSVESMGEPAIYATVEGCPVKIRLNDVSGAINRISAMLLAIASRERSVVLIDEIDNGVYFEHQGQIWRETLKAVASAQGQIFTTTHSAEWLQNVATHSAGFEDEIAIWRMHRNGTEPKRLTLDDLKDRVDLGVEVR